MIDSSIFVIIMSWRRISLCLCIYGVLKEFRPSESYVISFLQSPRMNFTETQVNNEILPIGIYSSLISMIFVSLMTDWLRYKIVIVIQALCGVGIYALLSFCTTFVSVFIVQILYGIFIATEVAYYTYIYSVVDITYYQKVTSYIRVAHLVGRFFSGFFAQLFILTEFMDIYQLNFLTLGSLIAATIWTYVLPPVKINKQSIPENQELNVIATTTETISENLSVTIKSTTEDSTISLKYIRSMCKEFENLYVLKWSIWIITSTCCFNQVLNYIQSLWKSLNNDKCPHNYCSVAIEWNGAVDAIYTILSSIIIFVCGSIKLNMKRYSNLLIMTTSIIQFITLYTPIAYNSIYMSYINFIIYSTIYQAMITISSLELAKCIKKDKHGFVFGINNLLAVAFQSLTTIFMNMGNLSSSKVLFEWYAVFCLLIGVCYLFLTIGQFIKK